MFGVRNDVVTYGIAPNNYGVRNLESSKLLDDPDQHFAKFHGIDVEEHLVFSIPADTFTTSMMQPVYYPPKKSNGYVPIMDVRNCLWQLFGRVGYRALMDNFPKKNADEDEDDIDDMDFMADGVTSRDISAFAPPLCFVDSNGKYNHSHNNPLFDSNFNRWSRSEQQKTIDRNDVIQVVSLEEYNREMASYEKSNGSTEPTKKGNYYVLLEYFEGATQSDICSGYRIWILKERNAIGSLSAIMADIIASANEKPKGASREWKTKYAAQWRKVNNSKTFGEWVGTSLYCKQDHFQGDFTAVPLQNEANPVHPSTIFSVGQWLSILYGTPSNPRSSLPMLFPGDIDPERFVYTNYFDKGMKKFKPSEKFRGSMYLCDVRDLEEDVFMEKYRLDIYKNYILEIMRSTLGVINKPKPIKTSPFSRQSLPVNLSANKAWKSFEINPTKEHYLVGQAMDFNRPFSDNENTSDIVFEPGEDDYFLFIRALARQHISTAATKELNLRKDFQSRRKIRLDALSKCLQFVRPLFVGSGNTNVSSGLKGIINTSRELHRNRFSRIFVDIANFSPNLHFQDLFLLTVLDGAEHYLFLSTLQCELYAMLINIGCAYMLIRDKTHLNLEGPPGTGKSQLLQDMKKMKCDGVCVLETNNSLFSNLFGKHKTFEIAMRHEPDPRKTGGKITKGNLQAMQMMELEKSLLSEQQGRKQTTVFDNNLNKFRPQVINIILSCTVVQCQNYATDQYAGAIVDRFFTKHVPKRKRFGKDVAYMQTAEAEMTLEHMCEQKIFFNTCNLIDSNLGKLCAMCDMPCALSEPNFEILTDVVDHLKKTSSSKFVLDSRAINRCKNNARTQIQYDALQILLYHKPKDKELNFYIGDVKVSNSDRSLQKKMCTYCRSKFSVYAKCCTNVSCELYMNTDVEMKIVNVNLPTRKMLSQVYTDADTATLNDQQYCIMFRQEDGSLGYEETREVLGNTVQNEEVQIRIDLIYNEVYSIEPDKSELLEPQPLRRVWEYTNLFDPKAQYEKGDVVKMHFTGEAADYSSYYEEYKYKLKAGPYQVCLKTGKVYQEEGLDENEHGKLTTRFNFPFDMHERVMSEKFLTLIDEKEKQLCIKHNQFNELTCSKILESLEMNVPKGMTCKQFFKKKRKIYKVYLQEFFNVWQLLEDEDGIERHKESLLGKYKDEELDFSGKQRSIEMWRDIDLLLYCTVDVAVRTLCLMRDEFLPEYTDKMKLAIAQIAHNKLHNFKANKPFKHFMPNNDQGITASADDVDMNYLSLDSLSQFKIELRSQLDKKLTQGLKVDASDIMIERTLTKLNNDELATVKYEDMRNPVFIEDGVWKFFDLAQKTKENIWKRNHEYGTVEGQKMPALKRKRQNIYIHIAWVSDILHNFDTEYEIQTDCFLQNIQTYKYPGAEGEKKKILIGSPWTGKIKNAKGEKIDHCEPPTSAYVEVTGKANMKKTSERKNQLSKFSQLIHGRVVKKQRLTNTDEIFMSYDRHVACKRAKQLNEHNEKLHKDLWKQFKHLSKQDLLQELQESQPAKYEGDYPNDFVQYQYNFRNTRHKKSTAESTDNTQ